MNMKLSAAGFSTVEAIVGASILVLVLYAAANVFKPISTATKKAKILSSMMRVENLIREGVYLQTDYSNSNSFEIKNGNDIVAKHGVVTFLNDNLSPCSNGNECALQTRVEVVDFNDVNGDPQKGIVYQIASGSNSGVRILPLGEPDWSKIEIDKETYMVDQDKAKFGASSTTVVIPPSLVTSTFQKCDSGFMRGIANGNKVICWNFVGDKQCPSWSLPVGYSLDEKNSTMTLLCQRLNYISCPSMSVNVKDPHSGIETNKALDNFYSLNKIVKDDLYPPRAIASKGASECRSIIDFKDLAITNVAGVISAAVVTAKGARCPDENLYRLFNGTCVPNFNPDLILKSTSANILQNKIQILPASEMRANSELGE